MKRRTFLFGSAIAAAFGRWMPWRKAKATKQFTSDPYDVDMHMELVPANPDALNTVIQGHFRIMADRPTKPGFILTQTPSIETT